MENSKQIRREHWTDGGTMITNFKASDFDLMSEAIDKYSKLKPDHSLVISNHAYDYRGDLIIGLYSLHQTENTSSDLSIFWNLQETIRREKFSRNPYELTDKKIDELIKSLSGYANDVDKYCYGLPSCESEMSDMRSIVRGFLAGLKK